MHQQALRTVLLIQAIEETDRLGEVIPLADRTEASRSVVRASGAVAPGPSVPLTRESEQFLARRAEHLLARLRARSPAVIHVLALAGGLSWLGRALLVLALIAGLSLSALDGSRRINILAFPLLGLIAWNLLVYLALLVAAVRRSPGRAASAWTAGLYERWISGRIEWLLRRSTRFNVPLTNGLRRFVADWSAVAEPMWIMRGKRLLHLAAALMATGLVAGLYVRGIALRYEAGWESTFLGPTAAHTLVEILYGPAAAVLGVSLPDSTTMQTLRWTGQGGGGDAAIWIHLIALTAALYIVIPRLIAALVANVSLWRFSRHPPAPASLLGYSRAIVLSVGDGNAREVARVTPYAYEPGVDAIAGLELLLAATVGVNLSVDLLEPIKYGAEEGIVARLAGTTSAVRTSTMDAGRTVVAREPVSGSARPADWNVLVMTLASTPEVENHGLLISKVRDWLAEHASAAPLLIVIDEGPFTARMRGDAGFDARIAERRRLWQQFIAGYAVRACFAELARMTPGSPLELEARDSARSALWTASERP